MGRLVLDELGPEGGVLGLPFTGGAPSRLLLGSTDEVVVFCAAGFLLRLVPKLRCLNRSIRRKLKRVLGKKYRRGKTEGRREGKRREEGKRTGEQDVRLCLSRSLSLSIRRCVWMCLSMLRLF